MTDPGKSKRLTRHIAMRPSPNSGLMSGMTGQGARPPMDDLDHANLHDASPQ
jgi:hypothetical protein